MIKLLILAALISISSQTYCQTIQKIPQGLQQSATNINQDDWNLVDYQFKVEEIQTKKMEKSALENGTPFTWSQNEPLSDLEKPERVAQIKDDFEKRKLRELANRKLNPLRMQNSKNLDIDDLYLDEEGGGACLVCHK